MSKEEKQVFPSYEGFPSPVQPSPVTPAPVDPCAPYGYHPITDVESECVPEGTVIFNQISGQWEPSISVGYRVHKDDAIYCCPDKAPFELCELPLPTPRVSAGSDLFEIARSLGQILGTLTGESHEPVDRNTDSLTVTRHGWISTVVKLQRLRNWVEGLAETHRSTWDE